MDDHNSKDWWLSQVAGAAPKATSGAQPAAAVAGASKHAPAGGTVAQRLSFESVPKVLPKLSELLFDIV